MAIWTTLLTKLGYKNIMSVKLTSFYNNSWLLSSEPHIKNIRIFYRCYDLVKSDKSIGEGMEKNNMSFYVYERLPVFYFAVKGWDTHLV